jgi:6-pyruvoyl-tetrahydropterin synthase
MVATEVKSTIHEMIDKIDDSEYLIDIYDSLSSFLNQKTDIYNELSEYQKKRIPESLLEVRNGKFTTNEQMKEEVKKWLTK